MGLSQVVLTGYTMRPINVRKKYPQCQSHELELTVVGWLSFRTGSFLWASHHPSHEKKERQAGVSFEGSRCLCIATAGVETVC